MSSFHSMPVPSIGDGEGRTSGVPHVLDAERLSLLAAHLRSPQVSELLRQGVSDWLCAPHGEWPHTGMYVGYPLREEGPLPTWALDEADLESLCPGDALLCSDYAGVTVYYASSKDTPSGDIPRVSALEAADLVILALLYVYHASPHLSVAPAVYAQSLRERLQSVRVVGMRVAARDSLRSALRCVPTASGAHVVGWEGIRLDEGEMEGKGDVAAYVALGTAKEPLTTAPVLGITLDGIGHLLRIAESASPGAPAYLPADLLEESAVLALRALRQGEEVNPTPKRA